MIRKLLIASLLLCGVALAQPPQGGPAGPGFDGSHDNFGPHGMRPGGEMRGEMGGEMRGGMHGILPPGRWWKNAEVVKAIGLDDVQIQKIEKIFQESRMKLVDVHANLQKEEFKLEPLLEADSPDENAVLSAIDRIAATRTSLEKANAQMAFAIRRVLTPEQWKKLRALRPARDHFPPPMRGPHGKFQRHGRSANPPSPAEPPPPAPDDGTAPQSSK